MNKSTQTVFTAAELAAILAVSPRTIWRMRDQGSLVGRKIGGVDRFSIAAIEKFLASRRMVKARGASVNIMEGWMTPDDVAAVYGKHVETIKRWCRGGQIPHYRIGRLIRMRKSEVFA